MSERRRVRSAATQGDFPVGIPIIPPPDWRPRKRPPPLPGQRRRGASFDPELVLVFKALLFALLVIVCMGVGWLLTQGRRPARTQPRERVVAQAPPAAPKKSESPPPAVLPPQEKREEPPAVKQEAPAPAPAPQPKDPPGRAMTYEKDVLPILQQACISCHGTPRKRGGLDLRTYAALVRGGDNGTAVVPGRPDDSPLYESIASGRMPPGKRKLPARDKDIIRAWIASGARSERPR
jgi:hypothetical protein